jgi:hypothetical protein
MKSVIAIGLWSTVETPSAFAASNAAARYGNDSHIGPPCVKSCDETEAVQPWELQVGDHEIGQKVVTGLGRGYAVKCSQNDVTFVPEDGGPRCDVVRDVVDDKHSRHVLALYCVQTTCRGIG